MTRNSIDPDFGFFASILPVFPRAYAIPKTDNDIRRVLQSDAIRHVYSFALGPRGTNMIRAAENFHIRMGIEQKACIFECKTPEESIQRAHITTNGILGVFWTCAVYFLEHVVFFENPSALPFAFQQVQKLDVMQLACTRSMAAKLVGTHGQYRLRIAAHGSPKSLVARLDGEIVPATSNAHAAARCATREADVCITTETARQLYGLVKIHSFGSPDMVFFGGISGSGGNLLESAFTGQTSPSKPTNSAELVGVNI